MPPFPADFLLVLVGPTAVGKTAVGIELARRLGGEIISADAVAVYQRLDIGAAKPTAAEQAQVPFHLIDVVAPDDDFTLTDFETRATRAMAEIRARGRVPIVVGGTGLYVRALTAELSIPNVPPQPTFRAERWAEVEANGSPWLHARLQTSDPESAAKIQPGDAKRIIRALEVHAVTGQPLSQFHTPEGVRGVRKPGVVQIALDRPRESLYERIDQRVDQMMAQGFLAEVQGLLDTGVSHGSKSMQSLGYRHLVQFLRNGVTLEETIAMIKRDTRRFAKRQLSWFRNDPAVHWVTILNDVSIPTIVTGLQGELERISV